MEKEPLQYTYEILIAEFLSLINVLYLLSQI